MNEDPFKKRERLAIRVEIAKPEDWPACKRLRLLSITGADKEMFNSTPEKIAEEENMTEEQWREEASSKDKFSVLAWSDLKEVGLGRARKTDKGDWSMRNGFVKTEFRAMGIQQKMIALRLKEIKKRRGIKVRTGVNADNLISLHNVQKFGFKVIEQEGGWCILETDLNDPEVTKKINEVLKAG